jgi:hypothetical protein
LLGDNDQFYSAKAIYDFAYSQPFNANSRHYAKSRWETTGTMLEQNNYSSAMHFQKHPDDKRAETSVLVNGCEAMSTCTEHGYNEETISLS